jgi:hypothetical protein
MAERLMHVTFRELNVILAEMLKVSGQLFPIGNENGTLYLQELQAMEEKIAGIKDNVGKRTEL